MTDFIYHNYNFVKPVADLNAMRLNLIAKTTKRIARKKGQPQGVINILIYIQMKILKVQYIIQNLQQYKMQRIV